MIGLGGRDGETMLERTYTVYVYPDMSVVSLSKKFVEIYIVKNSYSAEYSVEIDIKGASCIIKNVDVENCKYLRVQ